MRYIRTGAPARAPQLLQVAHRQCYDFALLHAEEERYHCSAGEEGNPSLREHAHNVYHLALYTSGENRFLLDGVEYPSRRGTLVMTAPGQRHCFAPCLPGGVASKELTFCFEADGALLLLPAHQLLSLLAGVDLPAISFPMLLSERQTQRFETAFDLLIERLAIRDALCWFAEQQLMLELLAQLLYALHDAPHPAARLDDDPLLKVRAEIEQRFNERLAVDELAQGVFLSAGYLTRAFKARFGLPPIAYQQSLRISAAKTLLATTARSVTEIAGLVGYQEIGSFTRVFTRTVGESPLAYRKRMYGSRAE